MSVGVGFLLIIAYTSLDKHTRCWKFVQGGLHQISWFQFLPHEPELNLLPDKRLNL